MARQHFQRAGRVLESSLLATDTKRRLNKQGFHRRLVEDIENDRVLWSAGPRRNSIRAEKQPKRS